MGRLLAFELAHLGFGVTLFDRQAPDAKQGCSWVGAGMLAPIAELDVAEPEIATWGLQALALWPEILERLGKGIFFQQRGSLVVTHQQDAAELARFSRKLQLKCQYQQLFRQIDKQALTTLEPELATRFSRGLFFESEGQLEPKQLLPALLREAQKLGIRCRFQCDVEALTPGKVHTGKGAEVFDWVIDARGMGGTEDMPSLRGVRGELIRIKAPEVKLNRPIRLMHPRYPLYVVPRPDHQYLIGATTIENQEKKRMTLRSALELLSAAYSLHSGFAEAEIMEFAAEVRPALPNHLPRIYEEPGLLRINGLYRHGYLLSPFLVKVITTYLKTARMEEATSLWEVQRHARTHG